MNVHAGCHTALSGREQIRDLGLYDDGLEPLGIEQCFFTDQLEPRKNVGTLLRSYSSLLKQRRDTPPLVLGGSATSSATSWLKSLKRPPLLNHAQHIGYVPEHERHTLYQNAKLLVLPSLVQAT